MSPPEEMGLLVDYGGVLTSSAGQAFRAFERETGLPKGTVIEIIVEAYRRGEATNPIVRFERGESTPGEFATSFAEALAERGHDLDLEGLHLRMFSDTTRVTAMWRLVARARAAGVATGLLSNSWGVDGYPIDELEAVFDDLVISGEVGLRKPEPEIYLLAAERIGRSPEQCAFVDDLEVNVVAARDVGMCGVHHTEFEATAACLEEFLGIALRD